MKMKWKVIAKAVLNKRQCIVIRKAYFKHKCNAIMYKDDLIQKYCMTENDLLFNDCMVDMDIDDDNEINHIIIYMYYDK